MSKKYQCIQSENCKQAVIFARVSSKEQEPGSSLDAQHDIMAEYCQKRGLAILKNYRVIESSTVGKRTKFNEMLEFVKKQKQKTGGQTAFRRQGQFRPARRLPRKQGY